MSRAWHQPLQGRHCTDSTRLIREDRGSRRRRSPFARAHGRRRRLRTRDTAGSLSLPPDQVAAILAEEVTPSCGNVFADLGFEHPEEEEARADRMLHRQATLRLPLWRLAVQRDRRPVVVPRVVARSRGRLRPLEGQHADAIIEALRDSDLPPDEFPDRPPQGEVQEREPFEDLDEDRWWQQHGRNPAVAAALEFFDGDREAALEWMTTPEWGLGGAHPITEAQTPDGIQHVITILGRMARGLGA